MTEVSSSWSLVTNLDHHLIYQQTETKEDENAKTLILLNDGRPSTWKVKGLLGFDTGAYEDSKYPIFADNTTLDQAKATAHDVMDADSDITPIRKEALTDSTQAPNNEIDNGSEASNTNQDKANTSKGATDSSSPNKSNTELSDFM